jgi:hypothetical protein
MDTGQATDSLKRKGHCRCSVMSRKYSGYTSPDTALWLPDGLHLRFTEHFKYSHNGDYSFNAAPHTVYSFFAEFDLDIALFLLSYGIQTVGEANEYLSLFGYGWLACGENAHTSKLACLYGISVDDYIDLHIMQKKTVTENTFLKDALTFMHACQSAKRPASAASLISSDQISLKHIEEIGYDLIGHCIDSEHMTAALRDLRHTYGDFDGPGYTTKDLKVLLEKCNNSQEMIRRLKIMNLFGYKPAFDAVHLGYLSDLLGYKGYRLSPEQIAYADHLFGVLKGDSEKAVGSLIPQTVITPLCEANVPAEFAAEKLRAGETTDRIVAMNAGVHTSMTEGWL